MTTFPRSTSNRLERCARWWPNGAVGIGRGSRPGRGAQQDREGSDPSASGRCPLPRAFRGQDRFGAGKSLTWSVTHVTQRLARSRQRQGSTLTTLGDPDDASADNPLVLAESTKTVIDSERSEAGYLMLGPAELRLR